MSACRLHKRSTQVIMDMMMSLR